MINNFITPKNKILDPNKDIDVVGLLREWKVLNDSIKAGDKSKETRNRLKEVNKALKDIDLRTY